VLADPPPVASDTPGELASQLDSVVAALSDGGAIRIVRRVQDALRAGLVSDVDDPPPDAGQDHRGWILWMIEHLQTKMAVAEKAHNMTAAKQYAAILEKWGKTLKQYDVLHAGSGDVVAVSRGDIDRARGELRDLVRAWTANGPLCAECHRRIRASWAGAEGGEDDVQ
jgi:hypothetical protein